MEVVGSNGNNILWEVVDNHVVEEVNDHDEIGLQGFGFKLFGKDKEGVGREGLSEYPYLLMLIKLWLGGGNNQSKRMNMKLDEENCKSLGVMNGRYRKVWQFSRNEFWKNIGCLVSAHTSGIGGSTMWDKKEAQKIS